MDRMIARETRAAAPGDPPPADLVVLSYEERYLRRRVLGAEHGEKVLVDLAEPVSLESGDRLILNDGRQFKVIAAREDLAEVRGDNIARLAWHIGNRHTPCQVEADRLLIQRDHVLEDMLLRLGAKVTQVEEPFTPEGGAYGRGRTHGHDHSHDPHADPNAHIAHRHG